MTQSAKKSFQEDEEPPSILQSEAMELDHTGALKSDTINKTAQKMWAGRGWHCSVAQTPSKLLFQEHIRLHLVVLGMRTIMWTGHS